MVLLEQRDYWLYLPYFLDLPDRPWKIHSIALKILMAYMMMAWGNIHTGEHHNGLEGWVVELWLLQVEESEFLAGLFQTKRLCWVLVIVTLQLDIDLCHC